MRFFSLFCLILFLSACAANPVAEEVEPAIPAIPVASQFPVSSQFRLEAGKHWQSIAEDAARALAQGLRGKRCGPGRNCRTLYLAAPEIDTTFSRAFSNALITALVSQGINVSNSPENALILHLDVQALKFGYGDKLEPERKVRPLAPNLWVFAPEARESSAKLIDLFPSRAAHGEIFVTLSVLDEARYVTRSSQTYYINAHDFRLYEQRICSRLNPCETAAKGTIVITGDPKNENK